MLKLKKIAITGGLASGKSSVCRILAKLGAYVVDSDAIVHNLLSPDTTLGKKIIELLGHDIVENGHLSRKKMAEIVFKDPQKLEKLEKLLHPFVLREIETMYQSAAKQKNCPLFAAEIPLLFEIGAQGAFDHVVAVIADRAKCKTRLASIGSSPHDYETRMQRQISPEEKAKKADFVLINNGSLEDLEKQVRSLFQTLTER